jgi:hypothetical protein
VIINPIIRFFKARLNNLAPEMVAAKKLARLCAGFLLVDE